jgi:hypothetical protein
MRRFPLWTLLATVLAAAYFSCGLDPLAGGSGTETVNTYVLLSDGSPAKGATVRIIYPECWFDSVSVKESPIVLGTVVEESGSVALSNAERNRECNIQIDHSEEGLFLPSITIGQIDHDTLYLEPYASYTGSFTTSSLDINQMYLSGSTYQASIGSDGNFFFNGVAAGTYTLVGVSGAPSPYRVTICGAVTLSTNVNAADSTLNAVPNRLLIDNFESGFGPTSLGGIAPKLWWYTVSDSGMLYWKRSSNSWRWIPYTGHTYTTILPISGENNRGLALHFTSVLSSIVTPPIATSGIFLKDVNTNGLNLSAMTSISMRVRGKGVVQVRFPSITLDSISLYNSAYSYRLTLTNSWRQCIIPVDSLSILDPVYFPTLYPWTKESKHVVRIEFKFSPKDNATKDTLRFDLDDLYLNGVGAEVLHH